MTTDKDRRPTGPTKPSPVKDTNPPEPTPKTPTTHEKKGSGGFPRR